MLHRNEKSGFLDSGCVFLLSLTSWMNPLAEELRRNGGVLGNERRWGKEIPGTSVYNLRENSLVGRGHGHLCEKMERGKTGSGQWCCWSSDAVGRVLSSTEKRMADEELGRVLACLPETRAMSSLLSSTLTTLGHCQTIHVVWTMNKRAWDSQSMGIPC